MKLSIVLAGIAALMASAAVNPRASVAPTCTTTLNVPNVFNLDHTTTIYATTVTATSEVDCAGCALTITSRFLGPGPVRIITATADEPETTATTIVCSPTPSVYAS